MNGGILHQANEGNEEVVIHPFRKSGPRRNAALPFWGGKFLVNTVFVPKTHRFWGKNWGFCCGFPVKKLGIIFNNFFSENACNHYMWCYFQKSLPTDGACGSELSFAVLPNVG